MGELDATGLGLEDDEQQKRASLFNRAAPIPPASPGASPLEPSAGIAKIPAPSANDKTPPLTLRGISPRTEQRTNADSAELDRLKTTGSGISQVGNPFGRAALRGLNAVGSIAGAVSPLARGIMTAIPGTEEHHQHLIGRQEGRLGEDLGQETAEAGIGEKQAQAQNQTAAAGKDTADARKANAEAGAIENPQVKPKEEKWVPQPTLKGPNGEPVELEENSGQYRYGDLKGIQAVKPPGAETQEQNKLAFQGVIGKLDAAGLSTDVKTLDKSLDAAKQKGIITPEEHATARAYQSANTTPSTNLTVHVAGQEEGQGLKDRNMHALVDDGNGHTRMGTVAEAKAAGVDYTPIKDPEVVTQTGRMANTIQISMNRLADPSLLKLFDNPGARAIISTATDDTAARQFGAVIPGIGGIMIPVPGGVSKFIDSALQNSNLAGNDAAAVRQYLAAYWSAREAMMNLMRLQSGGKQGARGAFQAEAAIQQLPGGKTPDSHIAALQMQYAQEGLDQYRSGIPDAMPGFKKEKSFLETSKTAEPGNGAAGNPPPEGKPVYQGHTLIGHTLDGKTMIPVSQP